MPRWPPVLLDVVAELDPAVGGVDPVPLFDSVRRRLGGVFGGSLGRERSRRALPPLAVEVHAGVASAAVAARARISTDRLAGAGWRWLEPAEAESSQRGISRRVGGGRLRHLAAIPDDRKNRLIPQLSHAHLPHAEGVSRISRSSCEPST